MTIELVYFSCFVAFSVCAVCSIGLTAWYANNENLLDRRIVAKAVEEITVINIIQRTFYPSLSDKVISIWKAAIFSVLLTIFIYYLSLHFGVLKLKDGGHFANNIYGKAVGWYLETTTDLNADLTFWFYVFIFYAVNNIANSLVTCAAGRTSDNYLEWPLRLLALGFEKALLLFATTSATLSIIVENFYSNKFIILKVFSLDSFIFFAILFVPIVEYGAQKFINKNINKQYKVCEHIGKLARLISEPLNYLLKDRKSE